MVISREYLFQKFWDDFLKEIDVYNSEKPLSAPKALFLVAEYDSEQLLFNHIPAHFFILNIVKTHRVAIQIIKKINQIKPAIESAIKFDDKLQPIDLLVFNAHGNNTLMQLSENEIYSLNDIKRSDFDGLSPNAEILLTSCKTANGLAQRIADVTRHTVFAPKDRLMFLKTSFTFCEKHNLYEMQSYDDKDRPIAFRFQEGRSPVLCDESPSTYFIDLRKFLIKKSEQGNADAQFNLGFIVKQEDKMDEAKTWYLKAALQGHAKAQNNLGVLEEKAGHTDVAIKWYKKAAAKGHLTAQFNLGVIEAKAGNIEAAKTWYLKAALQGDSIAQCNLGQLEEQAVNIDKAIEWYLKAAKQGHSKAQLNLKLIQKKAVINLMQAANNRHIDEFI